MAQDLSRNSGMTRVLKTAPEACAAFLGALIFGIAAQGMGLFNKFSWHDDIHSLFLTGATITSGRWMLHVLGEAEVLLFGDGHFSLPLMNGLFSLLCIGVAAGLIVRMLRIRSRACSALLGGVMAAFPAVTALFGFMFAVPYYMLAMLMMVVCAKLIGGEYPWWARLCGILLGGCSVGIYQAFLPLLPTLILLSGLTDLMDRKEKTGAFFRRLLLQGICVLGVLAVYAAGSRLFLNLYGLTLDSYMGISEAGNLPMSQYIQRAMRAWMEYYRPTRDVIWDMYPQRVYHLYLLSLGMNAVLGVALVCKTWRGSRKKALTMLLLLAIFPLGCNLAFIMSEEVHSLMVYGQTTHFILLCWLADRMQFPGQKTRYLASHVAAGLLAVILSMYGRYDNQCYLKITFQQQEMISWNTALIAQIKSVPGFRDDLPIAWVGRREGEDRSLYDIRELEWLTLSGYNGNNWENMNSWSWKNFMERWCGFWMWEEGTGTVAQMPEVQAMPCYPSEGSIRVIQDAVVVKFAEVE